MTTSNWSRWPAATSAWAPQYLEVRGLTVDFDGFKAVNDVDLTLFQGDLRFLIGPNGAGKTTVIDAITGLVPATGSVSKSGVELLGKKVHQIARLRSRAHVPDRQRVRAADRAAEPRHRRGRRPFVRGRCCGARSRRAARASRRRWRPSG